MSEIISKKLKVLDVIPYKHGVYCTTEDESKPFVNEIVGRNWSEDGEKVIFMLETHNFIFMSPIEEMDVVELDANRHHRIEDSSDFLVQRPKPTKLCEACKGKGKIEVDRK